MKVVFCDNSRMESLTVNSDFLIRGVEVKISRFQKLTTTTTLLFTPTFITRFMLLLCALYKDGRTFYAST
jgi:hypothetical protein